MDEKGFIPVARKLVNGITADIASIQMIVNAQLPIQIQLLVDQLQKPPKTASAHNTAPPRPHPVFVSANAGSRA
jgi:acetolactate synthase regulatory subunit